MTAPMRDLSPAMLSLLTEHELLQGSQAAWLAIQEYERSIRPLRLINMAFAEELHRRHEAKLAADAPV